MLLVTALLLTSFSSTAFASNIQPSNTNAAQSQKLKSSGLTDAEILRLQEIGQELASTHDRHKIEVLLNEYHSIIDETSLARKKSIFSLSGGTLYLDYTGDRSPVSNVIYSKVVYLGKEQVTACDDILNRSGAVEDVIDFAISTGVNIVTDKILTKLAAAMEVSAESIAWMIGIPLEFFIFVMDNVDRWDFNDAYEQSTTGKLKLEFFTLTSVAPPYYQNIENFEPWNDNAVIIPDDYDYEWVSDTYDCGYTD